MAASVIDMEEENSSSSDDETLKRCREAVWDCSATKPKDKCVNEKQSKRLVVADHEHDCNELQVTQGFQTHVAKKLGAMLDSLLSEQRSSTRPKPDTESSSHKSDEDEGFRLFSSSIPGQKHEEPAPPKRPIPSSSDSDSERESRLREAAVSFSDIISSASTFAPPTNPASPEPSSLETKEEVKEEEKEATKKKKKKKKKKVDVEENGQKDLTCDGDNQPITLKQDKDQTGKRKKKKKKNAANGDAGDLR